MEKVTRSRVASISSGNSRKNSAVHAIAGAKAVMAAKPSDDRHCAEADGCFTIEERKSALDGP